MLNIRMHGRGGQGVVVASKILADAYFRQDFFIQAFPAFGMERRGAPVAAFVRVSRDPILERGQIEHPDVVIVFDPALLKMIDVTEGLVKKGLILVNHNGCLGDMGLKKSFKIATVDASGIALKHGLGSETSPFMNTVILGAYAKIQKELALQNILMAITEGVPTKAEPNRAAAREAFDLVR